MTELPQQTIVIWRKYLEEAQRDEAWLQGMRELEQQRDEVLPQVRGLLESFLAGGVDVEIFRSEFDRRSRTEWRTFGLGGFGGGMFLNRLVRRVPDHATLAAKLKAALG